MITEDYVSFETAKLLKEKGFDEECRAFWKEWNGQIILCHCSSSHVFEWCHNSMLEGYNDDSELNVSAPILQMVMKWLRETHNLHIGVLVTYQYLPRKYEVHVMHTEKCEDIVVHPGTNFNTNEQACEAAIKYCLENLI